LTAFSGSFSETTTLSDSIAKVSALTRLQSSNFITINDVLGKSKHTTGEFSETISTLTSSLVRVSGIKRKISKSEATLVLDGIDNYIDMGPNSDWKVGETASSEASYAIWIKITAWPIGEYKVIMSRGGLPSLRIFIETDGMIWTEIAYHDTTVTDQSHDIATLNQWHFIVVTHSDIDDETNGYFDAELSYNHTKNDYLRDSGTDPASRFIVGAASLDEMTQERYFAGKIDHIKVWDRALTAAEVQTLYDGGDVETNMVLHVMMNETSGTMAMDLVTETEGMAN
jgi:hypothetical protein